MNDEATGRPYAIEVEFVPAPDAAPPREVPRQRSPGEIFERFLDRAFIRPEISISVGGYALRLPDDALASGSSSLAELVEAAYLFGDWRRVHAVSWQLRWIGPALRDEHAAAEALAESPPNAEHLEASFGLRDAYKQFPYGTQTLNLPGPRPPQWAVALVEQLRSLTEAPLQLTPNPARRAAVIARAAAVSTAYNAAVLAFRAHVRAELERVEDEARRQALQRLADARITILNQGWRLLGVKNGKTFEDWPERETAQFASSLYVPTQDLKDLTDVVNDLAPLGEAVLEADFAVHNEIWGGVTRAVGRAAASGEPSVVRLAVLVLELYAAIHSAKIAELRASLAAAQLSLASRLAPATARFPILFRFSPADLSYLRRWPKSAATLSPARSAEAILGWHVYDKLVKALDANAGMKTRFEAPQPLARARTAGDGNMALHDQGLARQCVGSVWAYPKVVTETLEGLYITPGTVARAASERLLEAVANAREDKERGWQAVMAFEGLVSLPLSIVCPPAGLALDLAFGLADTVLSTGAYLRQGDEYFCALNPVQAFAEVEPSVLPIVLSIGGVVLGALIGVKA